MGGGLLQNVVSQVIAWHYEKKTNSGGRTTMWSIKLIYQYSMMTVFKKIMVTSIKIICTKLKGEVGMAVLKSIPTLAFK